MRLAICQPFRNLAGRQTPAVAIVPLRLIPGDGLASHRLQPLGRTKAPIRAPIVQYALQIVAIDVQALALHVRATVAAVRNALVRLEAGPRQIVENGALRMVDGALLVGVLDADDEFAVVAAGEQVIVQGRA